MSRTYLLLTRWLCTLHHCIHGHVQLCANHKLGLDSLTGCPQMANGMSWMVKTVVTLANKITCVILYSCLLEVHVLKWTRLSLTDSGATVACDRCWAKLS